MKRLLVLVLLMISVVFTSFAGGITRGQDQTRKQGYRPGILVVKFKSQPSGLTKGRIIQSAGQLPSTGMATIDALNVSAGATSVSREELYQPRDRDLVAELGIDRTFLITFAATTDMEAVAKQYAADLNIEFATPDYELYPAVAPNDPVYPSQWGHNNTGQMLSYNWSTFAHDGPPVGTVGFDANAEAAWGGSQSYGTPSIVIAIIDGGVEWSHPDLRIWTNPGESGGGKETNGVDDDANGKIDDWHGWDFGVNDNNPDDNASGAGHGTACAGVAAAVANNALGVSGIAGGCSIMPLKAANNAGSLAYTYINNAIYYAADMGAKVISMSLGSSGQDAANQTACTYAWNKGAVVLAATGNENNSAISYPAANTNVIGVGAASNCGDRKRSSSNSAEVNPGVFTDPRGYTCDGERWWGSNYGSTTVNAANAVDVIAPTILPTTDRQGANGYDPGNYDLYFNGTSCATPYAAGVCALIFSVHPTWTAQQVRDQLCNTAQDIQNVESGAGWDRYSGYGMVDAAAAVGIGAGPSITVTSPNGAENWFVSSVHNITWTSTGTIANVAIDYTTDGTNYSAIAASTPNNGTYAWTIPNTPTTTAKVRVSDAASASTNDVSNADFTISAQDLTPPVISNVQAGSITASGAVITWTTDEASNSVVNYGLTTSYGSNSSNASLVTSHSITLSGLSANTVYHYRVNSTDAAGNTSTSVDHSFQTGGSVNYAPTSTTILAGTLNSGSVSNLATNNSSYYILNSTTSGTRTTNWYGSVTIAQAPSSVSSLVLTYDGRYSRTCTQVIYLYNWSTSTWTQIDSRSVSTTDITVTVTQSSPANFISATGVIRMRVNGSRSNQSFTCRGDFMQFTVNTSGGIISQQVHQNIEKSSLPLTYQLGQNYPNPFNPTTTISFNLPVENHVTLKIYDMVGREVATLVDGLVGSGSHSATWNAGDQSSGIYFYRLTSGSFTDIKKLTLIK